MGRGSETQFQVDEDLNYIIFFFLHFKCCISASFIREDSAWSGATKAWNRR